MRGGVIVWYPKRKMNTQTACFYIPAQLLLCKTFCGRSKMFQNIIIKVFFGDDARTRWPHTTIYAVNGQDTSVSQQDGNVLIFMCPFSPFRIYDYKNIRNSTSSFGSTCVCWGINGAKLCLIILSAYLFVCFIALNTHRCSR